MYQVIIEKRVLKDLFALPPKVRLRMLQLLEDLREKGPLRAEWPNYSRLGEGKYHCHIAHKWVACWRWKQKTIHIEVYYAGSRENAPY